VVARTIALRETRQALTDVGLTVLETEVPQSQALALAFGSHLPDLGLWQAMLTELEGALS
jgi:hypothetical protein